jgi:hypothetical protein
MTEGISNWTEWERELGNLSNEVSILKFSMRRY